MDPVNEGRGGSRAPTAGQGCRRGALAPERPVELWANGTRIAVLMCSPGDLPDLALGHLAARGMLPVPEASGPDRPVVAARCRVCPDRGRIDVESPSLVSTTGAMDLGGVIASACGSGAVFSAAFLHRPPVECSWSVSLARTAELARRMFEAAVMHRDTGGMHCAALARIRGDPWFVVREDVGRHNAVDKVIGRALAEGVDPGDCLLLSSGRIAADMALKAIATRIPVLASRSIPTTTARDLARHGGVTLIGRILSPGAWVYTFPERIVP